MRKVLLPILAVVILSIFSLINSAMADSRIWFVDGIDDGNSTVIASFGNYTNYPFGYLEAGGFIEIAGAFDTGEKTFDGGDIVNFALDLGGGIYKELVNDDATLTWLTPEFDKDLYAEIPPSFYHNYYKGVAIDWKDIPAPAVTIQITKSEPYDGAYNEVLSSEEVDVIPIEKIWAEKASLENKVVVIHGEYRGWRDDIPNPLITRSDWIIRDHTGAIYVTGKCPARLDPMKDIGIKIILKGVIKVSKRGVPYIEAREIMVEQ